MKKQQKFSSCHEFPKFQTKFSLQLEIEENSLDPQAPKSKLSETLAQRIPKLPESKFFPSSCRNINTSLNNSNGFCSVSANITTNQAGNNSLTTLNNLSLQQPAKKDTSINFSQFSMKSELSINIPKWSDIALPTTPLVALNNFISKLTSYEQAEILKFPAIYCIGIEANKKPNAGGANENYGFDGENGDYRAGIHDHIAYRYEVFELLGKGSFGQVFRVFDYKHKTFSALKIIKNKKRFHQQALVEIEILRNLRKKDSANNYNIVHIQSSFNFRNHIVITI